MTVVEDAKNFVASLPPIKVAQKLRTANREKICVEDEHCLAPDLSEAVVPPPANAFEHKKELAEGPYCFFCLCPSQSPNLFHLRLSVIDDPLAAVDLLEAHPVDWGGLCPGVDQYSYLKVQDRILHFRH